LTRDFNFLNRKLFGSRIGGSSKRKLIRILNEVSVISSQTYVNLDEISNDTLKQNLLFASEFACYLNPTGIIKPKDISDLLPPFNLLPPEIKEMVNVFVAQLGRGGLKFCDDGIIRPLSTKDGEGSAFEAKLGYNDNTGRIFLSFRGTEFSAGRSGSIITDIQQHLGFIDKVYKRAISLADMAGQCFGEDKLIISGYSMGGGMAQLAATVLELDAIVVNPAPISKIILLRANLSSNKLIRASERIYQLSVKGDIVSDRPFKNSSESTTAQIGKKIILGKVNAPLFSHFSDSGQANRYLQRSLHQD
ncbi:MAG: hypothetical protein LBI37_01065, partial [Puniceicoccales bacterium]|jgi:hypothetical protein|nr:hypothetical protein [Puniceicoccales bacterium]